MYCKYCGKQIAEDSFFCKYCGEKVSDGERTNPSQSKVSIKEKFATLPQKYQIAIISYIIWFLVWVCVLIGNSYDRRFIENYVLSFIMFTILFPFIIVSSIYIYKLRNKKNISHSNTESFSDNNITNEVHSNLKKIITKKSIFSGRKTTKEIQYDTFSDVWELNQFLKIYGPHVEKVWHKNSMTNNEYCTLDVTNPSGNTFSIRFHPTLGELTTPEIKERKDELMVVKRKDNNEYYLIDRNYEEWYEHLIL